MILDIYVIIDVVVGAVLSRLRVVHVPSPVISNLLDVWRDKRKRGEEGGGRREEGGRRRREEGRGRGEGGEREGRGRGEGGEREGRGRGEGGEREGRRKGKGTNERREEGEKMDTFIVRTAFGELHSQCIDVVSFSMYAW